MTLYETILANPVFQENLAKLTEDERKEILSAVRQMTDQWENRLLKPLKKLL
jgi:hypothetical protein